MLNPNGETPVSLGSIAERADKLEIEKPAETSTEPEKKVEPEGKSEEKAPVIEEKKVETAPVEVKKEPNDLSELRKWATKSSMELSEVKKQIQGIAEALSKSTKKQVDWKDLAKDPAKLESAIAELQKQITTEADTKFNEYKFKTTARLTQIENQRRMHDPNYPRWKELNGIVVKMAASGDSRIDFDKDHDTVLDELYRLAQEDVAKDPNYKAPAAPVSPNADAKYSEAELQSRIAEATKKAKEEAQKQLAAEENGAGVGGMGKSAPKGKSGVDKAALWNMPMDQLKNAIQQASDK